MKRNILSLVILTFVILLTGCDYDNYDPPKSYLTGNVVYNGNNVGVRTGGTQLELWQYGFQLRNKIPVDISQDGTYSARLFDGKYKLVRLAGAPWLNQTDSIDVVVSGNTVVDVPVTPYYIISGPTFSLNAGVITSTCTVTKVGTAAIENLTLYASTTSIVDANNKIQENVLAASALTDLSTSKTNTITLNSTWTGAKAVYVRLGVKTSGVNERFYTPVQKIVIP
jgi:hypothetical protein